MTLLYALLSPFSLLFLMIAVGGLIGRIRVRRFSLGIAGVLFAALLTGFVLQRTLPDGCRELLDDIQSTMKIFSRLGTSVFVSVIGIRTGASLKNDSANALFSFLTGGAMSLCAIAIMKLLATLDKTISASTFAGILCGALTSTPGLSGVCELEGVHVGDAVWGYGCAYLPGVLLALFSVRLLTRKAPVCPVPVPVKASATGGIFPEVLLICITALVGNLIGSLTVPFAAVSLGCSAGTLLTGLLLGAIVTKKPGRFPLSPGVLNACGNCGLAIFFVGTGYSAGIQAVNFNPRMLLYGVLISLGAILTGVILSRLVFARRRLNAGCVVAGGMTSSPAYGMISRQVPADVTHHFSFAYFGALLFLILAVPALV